jgi:3-deoxy-manno-octulosonate cytidylyltransferase (CMP-KDO synthetase)
MSKPDFRVVIPARYASTRLPGKPLLPIAGRPMIAHVWDRAVESGASEIVVATDDERIVRAVEIAGGRAMMTSPDHVSGTDRLAEVAQRAGWPDDAVIVNLQGDEPQIPGRLLTDLANNLHTRPTAGVSTLATPIRVAADVWNPNVVKVALDAQSFALYFSRAPIPWVRGQFARDSNIDSLPEDLALLRHIGLYGYRVETLRTLARTPPPPVERAESLEQLRALYLGICIHVGIVEEAPGHGVDTSEDLARVATVLG